MIFLWDITGSRSRQKYFWGRNHRIIKVISDKSLITLMSNDALKLFINTVYQSASKCENILEVFQTECILINSRICYIDVLKAERANKRKLNCVRYPQGHAKAWWFARTIHRTRKNCYSHGLHFITVKEYKLKSTKGKDTLDGVQEKPGTRF